MPKMTFDEASKRYTKCLMEINRTGLSSQAIEEEIQELREDGWIHMAAAIEDRHNHYAKKGWIADDRKIDRTITKP